MSMVIRVTCEETEPQNPSEETRAGDKESAFHTRPRQEMLTVSKCKIYPSHIATRVTFSWVEGHDLEAKGEDLML